MDILLRESLLIYRVVPLPGAILSSFDFIPHTRAAREVVHDDYLLLTWTESASRRRVRYAVGAHGGTA